jgi:hypothetical protein
MTSLRLGGGGWTNAKSAVLRDKIGVREGRSGAVAHPGHTFTAITHRIAVRMNAIFAFEIISMAIPHAESSFAPFHGLLDWSIEKAT